MKDVKMFSVEEVLLSTAFKGNQTVMAEYFGINRGVIGWAKKDLNCDKYCILLVDEKYKWFSNKGHGNEQSK